VNGSIGRTRRRTVGSRPHGRSMNLAKTLARRLAFAAHEARVRPDHVRRRADRTYGAVGECSREDEAQESTDLTIEPWPGSGRRADGLSRGAKLRSGRAGRRVR